MIEPWAFRHKRAKKTIAWALYQRRDLNRAALLHATAESESQHVKALHLDAPITIIPNGADLPEASNSCRPNNKPAQIALFLSRVHAKKGLPMLIEAWQRLRPSGWVLHIAGPDEGGHRAVVETLVESAGIRDAVKFLGPLSGQDKTAAYVSADLFILPTHSENFGMVVTEALAHELPVLTTTGAPWQALVEHGCGWWVEPTPSGITGGLRLAISCTPPVLREMGRRGRALVASQFGWDAIAERFLVAYENKLPRKRFS